MPSLLRRSSPQPWLWFLPLLAVIFPAFMAWRWSVMVPHADHWTMVVAPYFRWQGGASFWSVVHAQFNDSRYDVGTLIHFALIKLAHMNTRVESLVCVILAVVSGAAWIGLLRRTQPGGPARALVPAFLCTALWLSPDRSMNWMFGVQICYEMVVLASLAVIVLFQTAWPLWQRTLGAAACAFIATHSFMIGWVAWGLGLACLAWEGWNAGPQRRSVLAATAAWLCGIVLTALIFFHDYRGNVDTNQDAPLLERLTRDPMAFVRFFTSLIGIPFTKGWPGWDREASLHFTETLAPWAGVVALLLYAAVLIAGVRGGWRGRGRTVFPFLLLSLWGLANTGAVTLARTGLAASSIFQSRYLALTLWFHFGLLALLCLTDGTAWKWVRRLWLALVTVGSLVGFANGLDQGKRDELRYRTIAGGASFRHAAPEPSFLDAVNPSVGPAFIPLLDRLDSLGLLHVPTVRSERVADAVMAPPGAVIGAIKNSRVDAGKPALSLWAVDRQRRDAVDVVAISTQSEGQPELWLGLAQKRLMNPKMAERYKVSIPEDRIGWSYVHGQGTDRGFMSAAPNPFAPKPLPHGKVTFRAYAYDLETGTFTRLEGEAVLELP